MSENICSIDLRKDKNSHFRVLTPHILLHSNNPEKPLATGFEELKRADRFFQSAAYNGEDFAAVIIACEMEVSDIDEY